jgi:hypothetical protein
MTIRRKVIALFLICLTLGDPMSKLRFAVLVFAIGFSGFALAQTADQRGACKADYDKYCAGTMPGGGRIVACLNKQHDQLTDACRKVLDSRKKK